MKQPGDKKGRARLTINRADLADLVASVTALRMQLAELLPLLRQAARSGRAAGAIVSRGTDPALFIPREPSNVEKDSFPLPKERNER